MKRIILLISLLCASFSVDGRTLKQLFLQMPDNLLAVLSKDNKLDCIDYLDSGMKATVKNHFGESSTLLKLTENYLLLEVSSVSQLELKLLVDGTDSTLCMVKTYRNPIAESVVSCYDVQWRERTGSNILPKMSQTDFMKIPEGTTKQNVEQEFLRTGTVYIAAELSEKNATISFKITCDDGNPDLRRELSPYLKERLTYVWRNGRFALAE